MNTVYNVYDRTEEVMRDTWGHMAPELGKKYYGHILIQEKEWRLVFDVENDS